VGRSLDVGNITYFNGAIAGGTGADAVDLQVTLNFTSPSGVNQAFDYTLALVNTTNTADPIASADFLQFPSSLPTATFLSDNVLYTLGLEVGTVTGSFDLKPGLYPASSVGLGMHGFQTKYLF
jgi:hypothetical protein